MTTLICESVNPINAVHAFMVKSGQTVDRFDSRQMALYAGLQCEQLAEKLLLIAGGSLTSVARGELLRVVETLNDLAGRFKANLHLGDIMRCDHAALLGSDIDLTWLSIGAALSTSHDLGGAFAEVAKSKDAKLAAMSPANAERIGWLAPDLTRFISSVGD